MGDVIKRAVAAALLSAAVVTTSAIPAWSAVPEIPVLTGIRTGAHPGFDRIVLDLSGPPPRVSSQFVDRVIRGLRGGALGGGRDAQADLDQSLHPHQASSRGHRCRVVNP
ncbi:MAG TPA: hypothetical protein VFO16_08700 [Pseudonocardiaceae bacterium]|nr:hypothetical protein [Pseudonocardiaceae bacterium]